VNVARKRTMKLWTLLTGFVDVGYIIQCPYFMDIETFQNKVTAKSRSWSLSGFSLLVYLILLRGSVFR